MNKGKYEERLRSSLAQNSNTPRSQEDYITHVFEETEDRETKKLSQEFSGTKSQILGALFRLDDFLNPFFQSHSARETTWKAHGLNQRTNEDDSQSDPHPEASIFQSQTTRNSGTEDSHYSCPIR